MISSRTTDLSIEFQDVCLSYPDRCLFSDFNLRIPKGEKILLSGKSGVGKTTLFRLLLGFQRPDNGSVHVNGHPVKSEHIRTIRSQVFYLSQDIDFRNETVSILLDEIFEANNKHPGQENVKKFLSFLELENNILEKSLEKLSGGERQRLGLLTCFLLDRPLWLMDEPTAALDDAMKHKVVDYILSLAKTIVVISHDSLWKNRGPIRIERIK